MQLKEGDVVLCTVKSIEGTTVFLHIENDGEGSMVMSEVAAGRIRNLREYVYPNKKIVCKILNILQGNVQLSLRRVTGKEREEIQDRYKKEKNFVSMLKVIFPTPEKIIEKIKEKFEIWEFFDKVKENPKTLENFMGKLESDSLAKIISEKEDKEKIIKKTFIMKSLLESGIKDIKEILDIKEVVIHYLGSSQFSISVSAKNFKDAQHKLLTSLELIEKRAKDKKAIFELKEK